MAAAVASLGLLLVVTRGEWAVRHGAAFTAFAAGVLLTTAITLFAEALSATPHAAFAALAGYLLLHGANLSLVGRGPGAGGGAGGGMGAAAPVVAIGLHSLVDGIEYGVLFDHDARTGLVASAGLIAHEFAEGVILFALLRTAGVRTRRAALVAFLAAAVTTPLGAIASQPLLAALPEAGVDLFLAGAAGALLYVGATHLPMHLRRGEQVSPANGGLGLVVAYLVGVAFAATLALGHLGG